MTKYAVIYWSGTGNTEAMAEKVVEGVTSSGATCDLFKAADFKADQVGDYTAIAFGCPSMGAEVLEEDEFEPMFEACKPHLKGKTIALFGSYGWGDGEWMRNWEEDCRALGAEFACEYIICVEEPDDDARNACVEMGRAIVQKTSD